MLNNEGAKTDLQRSILKLTSKSLKTQVMLTCGLTMDKRNAEPVLKYFPLASKEELYPSTVYGNGSQMPPIFSKLCKTPQRNA